MPPSTDFAAELAARLGVARQWLLQAHDPERGAIGQQLTAAFNRASAREEAAPFMLINAAFRSFVWPPLAGQAGFQNVIAYGAPVLDDMGHLFAARVHEYIHALQYRRAAVLYADPFNAADDVVLHPLAYVQRKERLEQDAYAKGAWIQSLSVDRHKDVAAALDATPLSVADFTALRAQGGALVDVIARAAAQAAHCHGLWLHNDATHPARDLWHQLALEEYAGILRARRKAGQLPATYVRMGYEDIVAIGDTLGVNAFRHDRALAEALPELSASNRALLAQIEQEFGLPAHDSLPTLRQHLKAHNEKPARMIARARNYRAP